MLYFTLLYFVYILYNSNLMMFIRRLGAAKTNTAIRNVSLKKRYIEAF